MKREPPDAINTEAISQFGRTVPLPRVAIVGAGHIGSLHLEKVLRLQEEGAVHLAGVVDSSEDVRRRIKSCHNVPTSPTLAALQNEINAVIIAAPTSTHELLACDALKMGLHVLLEKPLAYHPDAGRRIIETARANKRIFQVGHNERFNPAVSAALALANRPRYIVAERLGPFTGRSQDVDVLLDLMIHDLDIVASLVPAEVTEIRALGVPVLTDAVDMAAVRLAFADGTVAQLSAGRASLNPSRVLRFFTLDRYVSVDCMAGTVKSVLRQPSNDGSQNTGIVGESLKISEEKRDSLYLQDLEFFSCIVEKSAPRVSGEAGLRALELCHAIKKEMHIPLG